ncbi:MAG: hypothetical protein IPJ24_17185 [bacterium]|nr:hypothetical protein [bacterium]
MRMLVCLAACMCLAIPAIGTTWHVAKDGSGDFSVIQDAVNAAASGDTIRVGAGRFDDKHQIGNPPAQKYVRFHVTIEEVTIIGAGRDLTVIGPAQPWSIIQGNDCGAYLDRYYGAAVVRIAGIRFENMHCGVMSMSSVDSLIVTGSAFGGHRIGIRSETTHSEVRDCRFDSVAYTSYYHLGTSGPDVLRVDGCTFILDLQPATPQQHMLIQATADAEVDNCTFLRGTAGVVVTLGSDARIHECLFDGQSQGGVANGGQRIALERCEFRNQRSALSQYGTQALWAVDNIHVSDVTLATLEYVALFGGYIRNSTLARGERYVVCDITPEKRADATPATLDMTNNWWGTADPDSIQAWIYDGNDRPEDPYFIQCDPFLPGPLPVQKKSLGGVKALFR